MIKTFKVTIFFQFILFIFISEIVFNLYFGIKSIVNEQPFNFLGCFVSALIWGGPISLAFLLFPIVRYKISERLVEDRRFFRRKRMIYFHEIRDVERKKNNLLIFLKDGKKIYFPLYIRDKEGFEDILMKITRDKSQY